MKKFLLLHKRLILRIFVVLSFLFLVLVAGTLSYFVAYNNKVYPNSRVANVDVSAKTIDEATSTLEKNIYAPTEIVLGYQDQVFKIKSSDINFVYDHKASAENVYSFTRSGSVAADIKNRIGLLFVPKNFNLVVRMDDAELSRIVSIIAGQISIDAVSPSVSKVGEKVIVDKGSPGKEVNQEKLIADITQSLSTYSSSQITIPVDAIDNTLDDNQKVILAERAERYLGKSLTFKYEYKNIYIQDTDIFKLLDPKGFYKDTEILGIIKKAANTFERDPQNPKFVFENGKVAEFAPALDGIKLDYEELKNRLVRGLNDLETSPEQNIEIEIPVVRTPPEITTDKVNNLGIKELLGRGTSTYYHSIPSRVHNVALAADRINGTLVKPGDTFSFNSTLGDVSAFTGYKQAYIISNGKTILGDGGGVCQVSTTLFRALLNSGVPISERQAHAYRVSYYEQGSPPGLDATVFSPSPDLKFVNDTPGYILIVANADTKNYSLTIELYGASDGRVSSISKPIISNIIAPPEDLYQDDPTLPSGTVKQIEYKAWGSRVSFNYVVTRNGQEIINKTFVSNYKPWQAVYLRGTGPAQ